MNDGGPAFPTKVRKTCEQMGGFEYQSEHPGMSLRAYLAGQALQGIVSNQKWFDFVVLKNQNPAPCFAAQACELADAVIAELERGSV